MSEPEAETVEAEKKPIIVKNATDLQRLKLEKLMKNPEKPVIIPDPPKQKTLAAPPDFVRNVMGSSAGAGSGEFHVYRHLRRKEYARQKFIQEKSEKDQVNKKKRKRVPNFTAVEKILLTKLINSQKDIIENKRTDGKMINKKKMAWEAITFEYNNNLNVHKRDTATLKRAWDNLKSAIRKARTLKGSQSNHSVAGLPSSPPDPLEVMNMVEEATAQASEESEVMYELQNTLDSDNAQSNEVENNSEPSMNALSPIVEVKQGAEFKTQTGQDNHVANNPFIDRSSGSRKASDFVRREGALRLRILEEKRKIEIEILKVQLDTRQKENLRADFLLEAAKLEVEYQRKRLYQL